MLFVMYGSSVFSSVFAITERSEMGLYDVHMFMSLFGFGIGMMKYASPSGPMCLMVTLSGLVALLFLLCFIATWTCAVVSGMLVVCSLSVFLSMCLFILCVLCLTVLVNCVLNASAICVGEVSVFSLKFIVFFVVLVFCWLVRVLSSKEYVWCVCDLSVCLGVPSICQICVFV